MTTLAQDVSDTGQTFSEHAPDAHESDAPEINVAHHERMASMVGGGLLTLIGIRRRSTFGALLAAVGVGLLHRGATGHCPAYAALGKNTAVGEGESSEAEAGE